MDLQLMCLSALATVLAIVALTEANLNNGHQPPIIPSQHQQGNVNMNQQQQRPQNRGSRFKDKQHVQDKE